MSYIFGQKRKIVILESRDYGIFAKIECFVHMTFFLISCHAAVNRPRKGGVSYQFKMRITL